MTRSAEDNYGRQPDTGTSKLTAAIDGTGGPTGDQTFNLLILLQTPKEGG